MPLCYNVGHRDKVPVKSAKSRPIKISGPKKRLTFARRSGIKGLIGLGLSALTDFVARNIAVVFLTLLVLLVISSAVFMVLSVRLKRLLSRYQVLIDGAEGKNMEELLLDYAERYRQLSERLAQQEKAQAEAAAKSLKHIQRVGLVRFNAFEDVGSNQSFSMALLDAQNDGVIISSLYGRAESRLYAKPVVGGKSSYTLSDEEKQAIREAMQVEARSKSA